MISNSSSINKFTAVAAQLTYPFVIQYFETEASARFLVYVGGVLQNEGLANDYTLTETAAVNGISPGGDLIFNAQPDVGEEIIIKRFTARTQPNGFSGTIFPADSIEKTFDRNIMISQEIQDELTDAQVASVAPATSSSVAPNWATAQNYIENQLLVKDGFIFRVTADHTSNTFLVDLDGGLLEAVGTVGIEGPMGAQGPAGADGADSVVAGPQGPAGNDGVDGVFAAIATQGEAQTGVDNTKGMTPLRTKQAIDFQLPLNADFISQGNDVILNALNIQDLNSRLILVENMLESTFGLWTGQQRIRNGQAVPVQVLGLASGEGIGKPFTRDGNGTRYAEVIVTLERRTDLEHRFSSFKLIMQFVDGVWYIKREKTHVLVDALEVDGVTLTVNNLAGNIGQLEYISDVMPGVDNAEESNIKFKGVELSEV